MIQSLRVKCLECHGEKFFDTEKRHPKITPRRLAEDAGWRARAGEWICPECREKMKRD